MNVNTLPEQFEGLGEDLRQYIRLQTEIFKCSVTEAFGRMAATMLIVFILALLLLALNLFIGLAFVSWFAMHAGPEYAGYLIVAGYYVVLVVLAVAFRRTLFLNPMIRLTAKIIISKDHDSKI